MPATKLEQFGGMLPAWSEKLLPAGQGAFARDTYLFSGELIGWRKPKLLQNLVNSAAKMAYRVPTTADDTILGPSVWMEFDDPNTSVVRSQVVDDSFKRYYWASPSDVPRYNTQDRIIAGSPAWKLGLNPPACAPIVTPTAGGNKETMGFPNPSLTGAGAVAVGADHLYLVPISPDGVMEILDVAFIPTADAPTARVMAVLYTDLAGAPDRLLNVGGIVQGVTAGSQVTSVFNYPTGLLKSSSYWLGIITDTALSIEASDDLGTHGYSLAATFSTGAPSSAAGGTASLASPQLWGDMTSSALLEGRAYVYTWLTAYGEESAPSPSTLVNGWDNGSWQVDLYSPDANDMGVDRNITKVRVYRTVPGVSGATGFFFVQEVDAGTASITDVETSDVIARNNQLASDTWLPPPVDLQQIVSMPNGMMVGFRENEVWFCEPYRHHAWPPGYVLTTEFPIVGLGVTGQALVACTTSTPYVSNGPSPASMSLLKVPIAEPCHSRGSILGRDDGVFYCSPYGLIRVSEAGAAINTTEMWITREKWAALTPSKFTRAVQLASCYLAFGTSVGLDSSQARIGFSIELNSDASSFTIWPQPGGHRIGFNTMTSPYAVDIDNFFMDPWSGVAVMIIQGGLYYYDFADQNPDYMPYLWRSKKYQQNVKQNYSAVKVFFTVPPTTPAQTTRVTAPTDDASWNALGGNQYGILRVYADDVLVTVREIYKSGELLRVLSDFKCDTWQFEIESRVQISNVQIATSVKELAQV